MKKLLVGLLALTSFAIFASEPICKIGGHLRGYTFYGVDNEWRQVSVDTLEECIESARLLKQEITVNVIGEKLRIKKPKFIFLNENREKISGKIH